MSRSCRFTLVLDLLLFLFMMMMKMTVCRWCFDRFLANIRRERVIAETRVESMSRFWEGQMCVCTIVNTQNERL